MPRSPRNSEMFATRFILDNLETLGWNIKNPTQNSAGQVYTQTQCLDNLRIAEKLGLTHPENIVKLSETEFYVIEAKATKRQITQAIKEAKEDYADKINTSHQIKAKIISGIAGNLEDGYVVKSEFLEGNRFKTIKLNGHELTSLVSPKIAKLLLDSGHAEIDDIPVDEKEFLKVAEKINGILHQGAIAKDSRGSIMASLILTFLNPTEININEDAELLVASINSRVNSVLSRSGKPEFYPFLEIKLPRPTSNHIKFKKALVDTLQELKNLNIPSAMNSGDDILGKFYEVFLKYGNWAKDVGIVFTPRHITKFAVEVLDIKPTDIIFDPTCGTGGFLVSAFDYIKKNYSARELEQFRLNKIFGVELQDSIIALAIVNMIFRKDGKTNMDGGDCFNHWLNIARKNGETTAEYLETDRRGRISPVTKVLMNPPFAQENSTDKEYKFVEHALKQMQDGGILFSVLPASIMVKGGQFLTWRKDSLLRENTLLAVIGFPEDLFYPIGVQTVGIFVKKGEPHPEHQKILWIKSRSDGFLKSKGKRLPNSRAENDLEKVKELLFKYIKDPTIQVQNIKEFQKATEIDPEDEDLLELLPEVYLDEKKPSEEQISERAEDALREFVSFMVKDNRIEDFRREVLSSNPQLFSQPRRIQHDVSYREMNMTELFNQPIQTGEYHVSGILDDGKIPLVSCARENGGFEGKFDIEDSKTFKNCITIASDGTPLTSFFHYYPSVAKDNVIIGIPSRPFRFTTLLFIITQLNSLRWRFSYGRKCYLNKIHKIRIFLPFRDGNIDEDYIETLVKKSPSWQTLKKIIEE